MTTLYTARVMVSGGRDGHARSDDGRIDLVLALPAEIGGSGKGTNPEQLFAAGFAACFNSSLRAAARTLGLTVGEVVVSAEVTLTVDDAGAYGVDPILTVTLPDIGPTDRAAVVAEAERICAYSNVLRGRSQSTIVVS